MAPESAKRGRASKSPNSPRSPKKAKLLDPVTEKVHLVSKTLSDPACLVSGADAHREMLLASIPHTLTVASDERHAFQTKLTHMVGQILTDHVADRERQVTDSKAEVHATKQKSTEQKNNAEASSAMISVQEEELEKCKSIVSEDSEAVKAAEITFASAKKEVVDFDGELQKTIAHKDHCASVYNECFQPLKSGAGDMKEARELRQKIPLVAATLQELCAEGSMLSAIAPALKKTPADRGTFDLMAVDGAEGVFSKSLKELQERIDTAGTRKAEKINVEAAAQEALTAATKKLADNEAILKRAKEELKSLKTKHKELLHALKQASHVESEALAHEAIKEGNLVDAKEVLAAFKELLERTSAGAGDPGAENAVAEDN